MSIITIMEEHTMSLPKTIGVTGAAGFIGSNLVHRLLGEGCTVIGVDDLSAGSMRNLHDCVDHPGSRCTSSTAATRASCARRSTPAT